MRGAGTSSSRELLSLYRLHKMKHSRKMLRELLELDYEEVRVRGWARGILVDTEYLIEYVRGRRAATVGHPLRIRDGVRVHQGD